MHACSTQRRLLLQGKGNRDQHCCCATSQPIGDKAQVSGIAAANTPLSFHLSLSLSRSLTWTGFESCEIPDGPAPIPSDAGIDSAHQFFSFLKYPPDASAPTAPTASFTASFNWSPTDILSPLEREGSWLLAGADAARCAKATCCFEKVRLIAPPAKPWASWGPSTRADTTYASR